MTISKREPNESIDARIEDQPSLLNNLIKSISAAQTQSSLYGSDHMSTRELVNIVVKSITEFLESFGRSTLVFTKEAVIVNDHYYTFSRESRAIFQRLHARGTIAITFTGTPPEEQVSQFIIFLNTDPDGIRIQKGASTFLRKHGVTRIAATEAVYVSADDADGQPEIQMETSMPSLDGAIAGVINWLSKHDEEEIEMPRVPITELLSQPDTAARLIREAVTKLHASRRKESSSELAKHVIQDMKDLAASNPDAWDKATPQIRKAMTKLPRDMRPSVLGFDTEDQDSKDQAGKPIKTIDSAQVDNMLNQLIEDAILMDTTGNLSALDSPEQSAPRLPALENLDEYFGVKSTGLLPNWQTELLPSNQSEASGKTFTALMAWEANAVRHNRMARALAALVSHEFEAGNIVSALGFAGSLAEEASRSEIQHWRCTNSIAALESLDLPMLRTLVSHALGSNNSRLQKTAALLVEYSPLLALNTIDLLSGNTSGLFIDSLKIGILKSRQEAIPVLKGFLKTGTPITRDFALDMLMESKSERAAREIEEYLAHAEPASIITTLAKLPGFPVTLATRICVNLLKYKHSEVRCSTLQTLGVIGDESALPYLIEFAVGHIFRLNRLNEQLAAIKALGNIESDKVTGILKLLQHQRSILFHARYERIRNAASQALEQSQSKTKNRLINAA